MCSEKVPIDIDGGVLEGGGQILRMAMSFSALLNKPIRVRNIRAGRSKPGLRPQHLIGLRLVRDLCNGKLEGDAIGSTTVTFYPGHLRDGSFTADTETAGSIGLLLQVALPCMLHAPGPAHVVLKGGTNAEMAPQIDYTLTVFRPIAEKFGCKFDPRIIKRGYYPKGGGEVVIVTVPLHQLNSVELVDVGTVKRITGRSFVAGVLPVKMAHEMSTAATKLIRNAYTNIPIDISVVKETAESAVGNGSGLIIVAETSSGCLLGGSALGSRGIPASEVGEKAASELLENLQHGGCVDSHLQDQLIIFMALAKGISKIKTGPITLHTQTAIHIAQQLTDARFNIINPEKDDNSYIECEGISLEGSFNLQFHKNRMECCIPQNPPHP